MAKNVFVDFISSGTGIGDYLGNEYIAHSIKISFDRREFLDVRDFSCWNVEKQENSIVVKFSRSMRKGWRTSGFKTRTLKFAQHLYTGHIFEKDYFWAECQSEYVSKDELHIRINIEMLKNIERVRSEERKIERERKAAQQREENLQLAIKLHAEGKNFTITEV